MSKRFSDIKSFYDAIDKYGTEPAYHLSDINRTSIKVYVWQESGGSLTTANALSTGKGLTQFLKPTWEGQDKNINGKVVHYPGVRDLDPRLKHIAHGSAEFSSPEIQALGTVAYVSSLKKQMDYYHAHSNSPAKFSFNTDAMTAPELYLAHKYAAKTAVAILTANEKTPITALLSANIIQSNHTISLKTDNGTLHYKDFTVGDLKQWAEHKMTGRADDFASPFKPTENQIGHLIEGLGATDTRPEADPIDIGALTKKSKPLAKPQTEAMVRAKAQAIAECVPNRNIQPGDSSTELDYASCIALKTKEHLKQNKSHQK